MVETSTIVTASVATVATGLLAYAVYFDYQRRNDVNFRRDLRRESRRAARAENKRTNAAKEEYRKQIQGVVAAVNAEGFPSDGAKREEMFMRCVSDGEVLSAEKPFEAALEFYKAMKVYPTPGDLLSIYDSTVKKEVLDILAEMIAADETLNVTGSARAPGALDGVAGMPHVGLD